jgi:hypothetical protein
MKLHRSSWRRRFKSVQTEPVFIRKLYKEMMELIKIQLQTAIIQSKTYNLTKTWKMVLLLPFLAAAALLNTAASAPATEKSIKDIVVEVFGLRDAWTPIYFKDIDPTATIAGNPINDSVIYAYEPPTNPTLTQIAPERISQRSMQRRSTPLLAKRATRTCFDWGLWLPQTQLWSAKDDFCLKAQNDNIGNGGQTWQDKSFWKDSSGTYQQFRKPDGNPTTVFYFIRVRAGFLFNFNICYNAVYDIVSDCHGTNPDSAGGRWDGYGNQVDNTVDPAE